MKNEPSIPLLYGLSIGVLLVGLALGLATLRRARETVPRIQANLADGARMLEWHREFERVNASWTFFEEMSVTQPEPIRARWPAAASAFVPLREAETIPLEGTGWQILREEWGVTNRPVPLGEALALAASVEDRTGIATNDDAAPTGTRPAWRLVGCRLRAAGDEAGTGEVSFTFEALEKTP
jgi:hypothetical protein